MLAAHPGVSVGHTAGAMTALVTAFCITRSENRGAAIALSFPRSMTWNRTKPLRMSLPARRSRRA